MRLITTIKLQKRTKSELDQIRVKSESYDTTIRKLMSNVKNTNLKAELIEGYKMMGKKELQFLKEWDIASSELEAYD